MTTATEVITTVLPTAPVLIGSARTMTVIGDGAAFVERVPIHTRVAHLERTALGFRAIDQPQLEDTLLASTQCMRDNGYDLDDPSPSALWTRVGYSVGPNTGCPDESRGAGRRG